MRVIATQLVKFYKFYSSPSKDDPSKTIEESFDNFDAPPYVEEVGIKSKAVLIAKKGGEDLSSLAFCLYL